MGRLERPEEGRQAGMLKRSGYRESTVENMGDQRQKDRVAGEKRTQITHPTRKGSWAAQKGLIQ